MLPGRPMSRSSVVASASTSSERMASVVSSVISDGLARLASGGGSGASEDPAVLTEGVGERKTAGEISDGAAIKRATDRRSVEAAATRLPLGDAPSAAPRGLLSISEE